MRIVRLMMAVAMVLAGIALLCVPSRAAAQKMG